MKRIAIIAGEVSGDLLAARLIRSLRNYFPDCQFEGIAGSEMQAAGCNGLFPMEKFSVMGLVEVLPRLPELLSMRKQLLQRWSMNPPDLFIGVDAPDLNLPVEKKLHAAGIPTVHYVSPSVWAWREKRVRKMKGNLDLMLTLFPFEADFYHKHGIEAEFVGHPLADEVVFDADKITARVALGLSHDALLLAVLPGSRKGEIRRLAADFLRAAQLLHQQYPQMVFATPAASPALHTELENIRQQVAPDLPLSLIDGQSRLLMQAADAVLLASGTAVLEGMLAGRLMVAAYRLSALTMWILRTFKLLKVRYVTLPNNLANEELVPEVLQEQMTSENLAQAVSSILHLPEDRRNYILGRFHELHAQLCRNASEMAAQAIIKRFASHDRQH